MSKYKYLFFDLDGTLTDSAEGITNSVAYALNKFGIIIEDKSVLTPFIGPPLVDAFMEYYEFSEEDAKKATEFFRERFRDIGIFENKVYDGVTELLEKLKESGFELIIATSKPEPFAKRILSHFGIDKYFSLIVGATFDDKISSKTEVIKLALSKLGDVDKTKVVMIGDRNHDILGAKATGLDSIGVLYGYGSLSELTAAGATHIADTVLDIGKILLS